VLPTPRSDLCRFVDYRPRGAARELFVRRDGEVLISGPAGTGKSRAAIELLHARCEKYPHARAAMIRKTRTSLTTTGLVTYQQLVLPPGCGITPNYQEAVYPNGSRLIFGGMDKASKIMSSDYDMIFVQEATELEEAEWEALTTRLRWWHTPQQQLFGDCNPGPPSHWLKKRCEHGQTAMLESRHEDNPELWDGEKWTARGAAYIAKLDALTGVRLLRLRKGIWAAAEGMVYDQWDPVLHLINRFEIPRQWLRIWVVDFGYTNPFVWQAWAMDPDGRLYRYREIYRTQTLVQDHATAIRQAAAGEPMPVAIICDHDAEDRATLERHLGMRTGAAFKSISPGIQAVQHRLRRAGDGRPRLFLMRDSIMQTDQPLLEVKRPTCTEEEIEGYVWPQTGGVSIKNAPIKKDDHGMDAMRYLVAFVDGVAADPSHSQRIVTYEEPGFAISPY